MDQRGNQRDGGNLRSLPRTMAHRQSGRIVAMSLICVNAHFWTDRESVPFQDLRHSLNEPIPSRPCSTYKAAAWERRVMPSLSYMFAR